jgi:hypothetical protein
MKFKILASFFVLLSSLISLMIPPPPKPSSMGENLNLSSNQCESFLTPEIFLTNGHLGLGFSLASIQTAIPYILNLSSEQSNAHSIPPDSDQRSCFLSNSKRAWAFLYLILFTYEFERGDFNRAFVALEKGLNGTQESIPLLHSYGLLAMIKGNLSQAAQAYNAIYEAFLPNPPAWLLDLARKLNQGQNPLEGSTSKELCHLLKQIVPGTTTIQERIDQICQRSLQP